MNLNDTIVVDSSILTPDQLYNEYNKLSKCYINIKKANDENLQVIHELKRNLKIANSTIADISQELDSVTQDHQNEIKNLMEKNNSIISEWRNKYSSLADIKYQMEATIEELECSIAEFKKNENKSNLSINEDINKLSIYIERESQLEEKIKNLKIDLDDTHKQLIQSEYVNEGLKANINNLEEFLENLKEKLSIQKLEIDEKSELINNLQEQLIEITSDLNNLKANPDLMNKKGNSLFAEVDDQRKLMKDILANYKKEYLNMQKLLKENEYQLIRLKRENTAADAMYREMQICTSIFLKADDNFKLKLNKHLKDLTEKNEQLQKKLINYEKQNSKEFSVSSILSYCEEIKLLQSELHDSLIQKAELEELLWNREKELAKFRFEALQSRCIITDRETLLEENKIPFNKFNYKVNTENINDIVPQIKNLETIAKHDTKVAIKEQQNTKIYLENKTYKLEQNCDVPKENENNITEKKLDITKNEYKDFVIKKELDLNTENSTSIVRETEKSDANSNKDLEKSEIKSVLNEKLNIVSEETNNIIRKDNRKRIVIKKIALPKKLSE